MVPSPMQQLVRVCGKNTAVTETLLADWVRCSRYQSFECDIVSPLELTVSRPGDMSILCDDHPEENAEEKEKLPINGIARLDDLRRSARVKMWPYMMHDCLSIPPVEAMRMELLFHESWQNSKGKQTQEFVNETIPKGVHYERALLWREHNEGNRGPKADQLSPNSHLPNPCMRTNSIHPRQHPADSCSRGDGFEERRRSIRRTKMGFVRLSDSRGNENVQTPRRGRGRLHCWGPSSMCHFDRPLSFCRGPRMITPRTECPGGCGEHLRVRDLRRHQRSFCTFRFTHCPLPGCGALVQSRNMDVHLKQECLVRQKRDRLAKRGNMANMKISCSACHKSVLYRKMEAHLEDCDKRPISCPRVSCNMLIAAGNLNDHLKNSCISSPKRNGTALEEESRKPRDEECPACHSISPASEMSEHLASRCPMRMIPCPKKILGCRYQIRAMDIALHLRKDCPVQKDRERYVSRRMSRRERVRCPDCGYTVVRQHFNAHQSSMCPNRLAPCKHWRLGCRAVLRLAAMDAHLQVTQLLNDRACLAFDGGKAYIALSEKDRKPPWTVELLIWQPPLVECTREKARTALAAYWAYHQNCQRLWLAEQDVATLEPRLVTAAATHAENRSKESEEDVRKLTDEMVAAATSRDDAKVELVISALKLSNTLAAAIRGVQELSSQKRPSELDRLALASKPWCTTSSHHRQSASHGQRARQSDGLDATDSEGMNPHMRDKERGGDVDTRMGFTNEDSHGDDHPNSPSLKEGLRKSGNTKEDDILKDVEYSCIEHSHRTTGSQRVDLTVKSFEHPVTNKEATFWADWIALSGSSLASRLLCLADETLPSLEEEVRRKTGLTNVIICRDSSRVTTKYLEEPLAEVGNNEVDTSAATGWWSEKRSTENKARRTQRSREKNYEYEKKFGVKLETRIEKEVLKRGGIGTLFASDGVLFQLEMGSNDRLGIKVVGGSDHIFSYRCPRERWVHLAFVSTSSGITLFENGHEMSRLSGIRVPLPMRDIGGRETACQCLLREIRYWGAKRSREQIVNNMHRVLSATAAVNEGIIGYWTCDEGAGEFVNDVTGKRSRALMVGAGIKWVTPVRMTIVKVAEAPVPSWREKNVCKVELRRSRMARRGRHRIEKVAVSGQKEYISS